MIADQKSEFNSAFLCLADKQIFMLSCSRNTPSILSLFKAKMLKTGKSDKNP